MELSVYLGRMPILDSEGKTFAYELLHRSTGANHTTISNNVQATARVLVNALNYIGLESLTGYKPAFIKVDDEALFDDLILSISPKYFILEILEITVISPKLVQRVLELRTKGYTFALRFNETKDGFLQTYENLLPEIDYLKIDTRKHSKETIISCLKQVSFLKIKCIAEKVEDMEDFNWAKEASFEYFEGYYFSKPQIYIREMIDPDSKILLQLVYLLKKSENMEEIIHIFNSSTYLSVNILKLIHLHHKDENNPIATIEQALIILGRQKLLYWIELMLYAQVDTIEDEENITSTLGKIARSRASLMEELALLIADRTEPNLSNSAYLVGILSLAETVFQSSFKKLFVQMDLDQNITSALHSKEGTLGDLFKLCIAVENNYFDDISTIISHLGISQKELNQAMMRSYKNASTY